MCCYGLCSIRSFFPTNRGDGSDPGSFCACSAIGRCSTPRPPTRLNLGRSSFLLLARSWSCPFVCKQDIGARSRKRSNEKESQEKLTRPSRKTSAGRCTKGPEQSPTWDNNRASFYEWMPPGTSTPTRD